MTNKRNNEQNLINFIVNTISENKKIKEFLNCAKHPEERKLYLERRIYGLFNGCEVSEEFLGAILYGVQLKTGIDLNCSPQYVVCKGKKVIATF